MRILGIETSCDETSIAIVEDGRFVLSCVIGSSKKDFEHRGGVIPEDAARRQLEMFLPVLERALSKASCREDSIDAVAVTTSPGLLGSLLVGTTAARVLASVWNKPIIPVHHTLGHLCSTWLTPTPNPSPEGGGGEPSFPILTLSVSGGHTDIWHRTSAINGSLIGCTRDDAAGEAFDKGAVMLGLPYPGGPALATLAESGDESAYRFPLPLSGEHTCDFSFSGLKTSLKYLLRDLGPESENANARASLAASYQLAICRHLESSVVHALEKYSDVLEIHVVGGVSANIKLRSVLSSLTKERGVAFRYPGSLAYCTDNGAMIASAGYFLAMHDSSALNAEFKTSATANLENVLRRTA